jgi:hypothetical protein
VLKRIVEKLVALIAGVLDVRYVAVPIWRPWRDF